MPKVKDVLTNLKKVINEDDGLNDARKYLSDILNGKVDPEKAALWLHLLGYEKSLVIRMINKAIDGYKNNPSDAKMIPLFTKMRDIYSSKY